MSMRSCASAVSACQSLKLRAFNTQVMRHLTGGGGPVHLSPAGAVTVAATQRRSVGVQMAHGQEQPMSMPMPSIVPTALGRVQSHAQPRLVANCRVPSGEPHRQQGVSVPQQVPLDPNDMSLSEVARAEVTSAQPRVAPPSGRVGMPRARSPLAVTSQPPASAS